MVGPLRNDVNDVPARTGNPIEPILVGGGPPNFARIIGVILIAIVFVVVEIVEMTMLLSSRMTFPTPHKPPCYILLTPSGDDALPEILAADPGGLKRMRADPGGSWRMQVYEMRLRAL